MHVILGLSGPPQTPLGELLTLWPTQGRLAALSVDAVQEPRPEHSQWRKRQISHNTELNVDTSDTSSTFKLVSPHKL